MLICIAMLLGMLPQSAFAAVASGKISEMTFTVTPPAIGEDLSFDVTVGNDSAYNVFRVEWYRVWESGSEQRYTTPIEAQVDGEYYALLYIEAVGNRVIPDDLESLTVTVNGRSDNVKLERESGNDTVYCYVYFDKLFYTVSFNANGGTGTMAPVTMTDGEFTVPECTFEAPAGMQFKAWRGLSCDYIPGEAIDVSSNVVLTAVYESSTLLVSVTGYITSTGDEDADISVKLFKQGESTPWMEAVRNGNRVAYIFNYLTPGTYVLKVSKAGHVEYSATIDALTEDVIHNVTLEAIAGDVLCGDVNLDGIVNSIDSNLLKRIVASAYFVEDGSAEAIAADVNGDGSINAVDSNLLKRMIAGA